MLTKVGLLRPYVVAFLIHGCADAIIRSALPGTLYARDMAFRLLLPGTLVVWTSGV